MLILLLIIALTNFEIITGVEENDHKFINSLPENEKKEFLQKVEKRIQKEIPEVKSPEGNDTNVDLYEKRLEDQGKSIQLILRSEINNLKSSLRRNTNDTVRQAHIDLTLRTQNDKEERRLNEEHANKNILFENIPVAVQYENENVSYDKSNPSNKTESKPDVITLENTNQVLKTIDTRNTSAERKRSGRRSDDFEVENVTLANPDTSAHTDAVDATRDVNINTKSRDLETTSDTVDISVSSESPKMQDVTSNTTRQENGTHANDENSRTAPGNIDMIAVVQHDKKLDYISSTQNNTNNISTDAPKLKDKYSDLTIESINAKSDDLVASTAQYDKNLRIGVNFSNTTQDSVNAQKDNVDNTSHYNLDIITILDSVLATTDSTANTETLTHVTADNVVSSTNKFTIMTTKLDSSTTESTKADILNKMKNNLADSNKIHNIIAEVDKGHHSTTQNIQNTISHNLPDSRESSATDGVIHKDHYETTQDNIDIIFSQSRSAKLDDELYGPSLNNDAIRKNLHSTSKYNVEKQKHDIIADSNNTETYAIPHKIIGVVDNKDHFITVGSKNIVDVDSEPHTGHDNSIALNRNAAHSQKGSKDLGNIETNKTITPPKKNMWLDVTESLYKTNRNASGNASSHKKHKTNKKLHKATLPQTFPKDNDQSVQASKDTAYTLVGLHGENNETSDNDEESQPKYVPVYNYDPENAYFRPNTERPSADNIVKRIGSNDPTIIKKTETHSKTTELDMYENGNKKSLRIKDIKARVISASNNIIKSKSDLYDILSGDDSVESADDDVAYEKPLKHSLKKIREKLYKHQINNKPKDNESYDINQSVPENTYKKEVRKKYEVILDKHEENNISELFSTFGTLLQKIVDDNNEKSSETKKDSNEGVRSDRKLYRDVALSLERHNKAIRNKGIQKIVDALETIQNNLNKRNHKENHVKHNKLHQSRFQVKDRDGQGERVENQLISVFGNIVKPRITDDDVEHEDVIEKSEAIKINDDYLELHVNILKDLVDANDEGLQSYDWLGTTVFIQAGLAKIEDITERKIRNKKLHPLDEELLEFCMKLHETALKLVAEKESEQSTPTERKRLSFRIPNKKRKYFNALNRMYGEMKKTKMISLIRSGYSVENFKEFLVNIRTFLHELHRAIKHISSITTYKKQRWFKNIKQLYLNSAGDKEYLELLLHLVSARLVGLIDERAKKIYRDDDDLTKREREVDRIEVEFVMVLRICNELVRLNN